MTFKQWIRNSFGPESRAARAARHGKSRRSAKSLHIPRVEFLENRLAMTVFMVANTDDSGTGSLRAAIQQCATNPGADTIRFTSAVDGKTIGLTSYTADATVLGASAFRLDASNSIEIDGETGMRQGVTIARTAAANFRLFYVYPGASLTLKSLTLSGGSSQGGKGGDSGAAGGGGGGGAGMGGAVFNQGTLTLLNSTLTGNTARGGNGGISSRIGSAGGGGGGGMNSYGGYGESGGITAGFLSLYGGGGGGPNGGPADDRNSVFTSGSGRVGGPGGGGSGGLADIWAGLPSAAAGKAGGFGGGGGGAGNVFNPADSDYLPEYNGQGVTGGIGGLGGFGGGGGGSSGDWRFVNGRFGGYGAGAGGANNESKGGGGGGGAGLGGAVFNAAGTVIITNSTFTGNEAHGGTGGFGAGNFGVSGEGIGGGLFNHNGTITITSSTFSQNTANKARSIANIGDSASRLSPTDPITATATINNSIIGQNDTNVSDFIGRGNGTTGASSVTGGGNLVGGQSGFTAGFITGQPNLSTLRDNGGLTNTMAIQAINSPAVDKATGAGAPTADQRGMRRAGTADIGAFEFAAWTTVVNTTADEAAQNTKLSLREAINIANGALDFAALSAVEQQQLIPYAGLINKVSFDSSLNGKTIELSTAGSNRVGPSAFEISSKIIIDGPTGNDGVELAIAAGKSMRFFDVMDVGNLTLNHLTLRGGHAQGGDGGHAFSGGAGGGGAGLGGAIFNQGNLTIDNSTLTGNTAQGGTGGGVKTTIPGLGGVNWSVLFGGGGGGGMGGAGGTQTSTTGHNGGGPNGGTAGTSTSSGQPGGFGGGGGGGFGDFNLNASTSGGHAGQGGFGGGGGGGGYGYLQGVDDADGEPVSGFGARGGFGGGGGVGGSQNPRVNGIGGYGGGDAGANSTNTGGGGAGMGGAIFNEGGFVTITSSTFTANEARGGLGGPAPELTSGHGAGGKGLGGGLFNHNGFFGVINSTFSDNRVVQGDGSTLVAAGRAIFNLGDSVNPTGIGDAAAIISDSIFGQTDAEIEDFTGASNGLTGRHIAVGNHNLIRKQSGYIGTASDADPMLGPLKDNGGPTPTMALRPGSPAIDAGSTDVNPKPDQRGFPQIGFHDIGAFEVNPPQPQTINFAELVTKTYGDADFVLSSTSTAGLPVSYTASGNASVYQDAGVWNVHIIGAGSATITAHQVGDDIYAAAGDVAQPLTINKANASIVVTPYTVVYDGVAHTATVTSIVGVNGETGATVGTVNLTGTKHTNAGNYVRDVWSFVGTANYNDIGNTTIANTIALTLSNLPNWTVNRPYTPVVTAAGRPAPHTFMVTGGTLPTGITLNANGSFSGSPTVIGNFTFTIQATKDAIVTGTRTYTVSIKATPVIGALTVTQWTKGHAGYNGAMALGRGIGGYSIVGTPTGMPPGLTAVISGNSIRFSGTPTTAGTFDGRITIKDAAGAQASRSFTIKINAPLTFTPLKLLGYEPGKSYSQTITTAGGTGARTVSYRLSAPLPSGLTISPPSPTTGAITITGKTSVRTSITITMTVTDAVGAQTTMIYTLKWVQLSL